MTLFVFNTLRSTVKIRTELRGPHVNNCYDGPRPHKIYCYFPFNEAFCFSNDKAEELGQFNPTIDVW